MISAEQIRAARAMLKWRAQDVADKAGLTIRTVQRIEAGERSYTDSLAAIQSAFEKAGIVFGADGSVRLERRGRK